MSLRMVSNASEEVRTSSRARRCSGASSVSSTSSTKPSTAFIGVRISWLMLARKALRAPATRSARSRASRIAASAALRSLMSSYRATSAPSAAAFTAAAERRTWMRRPSLRIRSSSTRTTSPRRTRVSRSLDSERKPSGTINRSIPAPTTSAAAYPNRASNAGFTLRTTRWSSSTAMATGVLTCHLLRGQLQQDPAAHPLREGAIPATVHAFHPQSEQRDQDGRDEVEPALPLQQDPDRERSQRREHQVVEAQAVADQRAGRTGNDPGEHDQDQRALMWR